MTSHTPLQPVTCYLGLGSNLGDRQAHIAFAIESLRTQDAIEVTANSRIYETIPMGGPPDQPDFLNAAAEIRTTLDPYALLYACQEIERRAGRTRETRNGPRTLDIDLLLYGRTVIDDAPHLFVPHPRMHERRFVLEPLCDIARKASHPMMHRTYEELLAALPAESSCQAVADARAKAVQAR